VKRPSRVYATKSVLLVQIPTVMVVVIILLVVPHLNQLPVELNLVSFNRTIGWADLGRKILQRKSRAASTTVGRTLKPSTDVR
jgi:hypothetical protein